MKRQEFLQFRAGRIQPLLRCHAFLLLALIALPASAGYAIGVSATIPVGVFPNAIAVNPATNRIYVGNEGTSNISVIDGDTQGHSCWTDGRMQPKRQAGKLLLFHHDATRSDEQVEPNHRDCGFRGSKRGRRNGGAMPLILNSEKKQYADPKFDFG